MAREHVKIFRSGDADKEAVPGRVVESVPAIDNGTVLFAEPAAQRVL